MRKIHILPNLFTSGNLFCGVLAMALTFEGEYLFAAAAILAGMVFDFCDGVVARIQRTISRFGLEYDSLADMVTFGVAPMLMLYKLHVVEAGGDPRTGLGVAFLFIACTALRLARYNVQVFETEKGHYSGLPSQGAAGVLASFVIAMHRYSAWGGGEGVRAMQTQLLILVTLPVAFLMVTAIRYPALVQILRYRGKRPFIHLVAVLLTLGGMIFFIEAALFLCFAIYAAYGPVRLCCRALTRRPTAEGEPQPAAVVHPSTQGRRRRPVDKAGLSAGQGKR